jgi:ferredoxin-NADP reductase/CRP-like cAMP-binding protein
VEISGKPASFWKRVLFFFINLKEILFHRPDKLEIILIKQTGFFDNLDEQQFTQILKTLHFIKYPSDCLIFKEGEQGDALYIIMQGSVSIFTEDEHSNKIFLARLNAGDYFGEQALLEDGIKTRNANIETISDVTLVKINKNLIAHLLKKDELLHQRLTKAGLKQLLNIVRQSTGFYEEIQTALLQTETLDIKKYQPGEIIFNIGDQSDLVYFILRGEVKLLFQEGLQFKPVILHRGHLFGELGVLGSKPRQATALANGALQLITLTPQTFNSFIEKSSMLRQLLSNMNKVYSLPMFGLVEQYSAIIPDIGRAITNVYKLSDGRTIIATFCTDKANLSFVTSNQREGKIYQFTKNDKQLSLMLLDNYLIAINAEGSWDEDVPKLCGLLLEKVVIEPDKLVEFQNSGVLDVQTRSSLLENDPIICACLCIKRSELQRFIDQGMHDFDSLSAATGAGTSCHGCAPKIMEILGQKPWFSAQLKRLKAHNHYINTYVIQLSLGQFKPMKPGQHIIIQAKKDNIWLERPYTVSDLIVDDLAYITLKKEPQGLFTSWLFDQGDKILEVKVTQPQGTFILNPDKKNAALCFAGGIGITPFISFAKSLHALGNTKRMHLLYCALTNKDFIVKEELATIAEALSSFTVEYRATDKDGLITDTVITQLITTLHNPDIYICGPAGFTKFIQEKLKAINYPSEKIFVEQFIHASSSF